MRAQEFLAKNEMSVKVQANSNKEKYGADAAFEMAQTVSKVVATRGKKVVTINMKKDLPDREFILTHLIGPSGNLRAPTMRRGKTLFVGFNDQVFTENFG